MFGFLAPIAKAVGGMFAGGNAAATLGGIGSVLGGVTGLKQANQTYPTVRENLLDPDDYWWLKDISDITTGDAARRRAKRKNSISTLPAFGLIRLVLALSSGRMLQRISPAARCPLGIVLPVQCKAGRSMLTWFRRRPLWVKILQIMALFGILS